jgi:hypothetical protein
MLGKEHPSTLASVSNLAAVLRDQGKYGGAGGMYRQALSLSEYLKQSQVCGVSLVRLESIYSRHASLGHASLAGTYLLWECLS